LFRIAFGPRGNPLPLATDKPMAMDAVSYELRLFSLDSSRFFGDRVAEHMGISAAHHEERSFEDGEHKIRPLVSVHGCDVYVVASLFSDDRESVNDKLCRMLFFLAALRDAGAARLTAVVPYLAYARKDRRTKAHDPVTTRYVAQLFEAVGIDRVMVLDVHNLAAYQNAFRAPAEHLEAVSLFVDHFTPLVGSADVAVVSPDAGGVKRADRFRQALAEALGRQPSAVFLEKRRSEGVVSGSAVVGDVERRVALIVDDLISTGTTLARAAGACRERGATAVYAAATHGLFMSGAERVLAAPAFDRIVVTNSVLPSRLPPELVAERLTILDAAKLFADAILELHRTG